MGLRLNRREFLSLGSAAVGLSFLGGCGSADEPDLPDQRPDPIPPAKNLVLVLADDWRADLAGHLGHPVLKTPNLDRLASDGVSATRLFSVAMDCQPARISLFSSLYGKTHGIDDNKGVLPESVTLLAEVLRDAGLTTGGFGKLHDGTGVGQGFVEQKPFIGAQSDYFNRFIQWDDLKLKSGKSTLHFKECPTRQISDQGIEFIRRHASKRFFTLISFPEPHPPYIAPDPYYSRIPPQSIPVSTYQESQSFWQGKHPDWVELYRKNWSNVRREDLQRALATYYAKIEFIDAEIGRIRQALEEEGILDQTVFLVMSDHGETAGLGGALEKGGLLYDPVIRQLMVLRYPGLGVRGLQTDQLMESVDIAPSLLELLDVRAPASFQGRSSTSVLQGRRALREDVVCVLPFTDARMVRTARHKLIVYEDSVRELYDLQQDPQEITNRIATADTALVDDLVRRLQRTY